MTRTTDGRLAGRRGAPARLPLFRPISATLAGLAFASAGVAIAATDDPCVRLFQSGFEAGEELRPDFGGLCRAGAINDTGIGFCGEALSGNNATCSGAEPTGQDALHGRDALAAAGLLTKYGSGSAGFDFSKLSNGGALLPVDAALGTAPGDWACTRDNVTGLVWEVKVADEAHPRHFSQGYTWYFPDSPDGDPGEIGTTNTCRDAFAGLECNTLNYVAAVNALGLCGANDWRLPTLQELDQITDYARSAPAIDLAWFPNTSAWWHWTSAPRVDPFGDAAWYVNYTQGVSSFGSKTNAFRVLLVRRAP
jgi:hypothetical protein